MYKKKKIAWTNIVVCLALVLVIFAGAFLRTMNVNWDDGRHLHPDERFLSQVMSSIRPVESIGKYFDTANSSLSPANNGFGFFVYGTLPVFIVRYAGEWTGQTGYDLNTIIGRQLNAYFDVVTILLVFFIGLVLYNKWVGVGGAALYAFAVLPIQQAHFMTVDSFTNTFAMLTVFFAVLILKRPRKAKHYSKDVLNEENSTKPKLSKGLQKVSFGEIFLYLSFGVALGMATASKINAVSLALLLPLVEIVRHFKNPEEERSNIPWHRIALIALAGITSFIIFRVFQPYAFDGPGFFGMSINKSWWESMKSLRFQATGEVDFPPALQWTRRPLFFSVKNLALWGIGIPFALTAFIGAISMLCKIVKRKELVHLPLLAWTAVYFAWQGFAWVKAMRYLLLIYPLLAIFASWLIYELIAKPKAFTIKKLKISKAFMRGLGIVVALIAILGTAAYAWAFTRIYTKPVTRVEASDWILETIPGPINLKMRTADGDFLQALNFRAGTHLNPGETISMPYKAMSDIYISSFFMPEMRTYTDDNDSLAFYLNLRAVNGETLLSEPIAGINNWTSVDNLQTEINFFFPEEVEVKEGETIVFELSANHKLGNIYLIGQPRVNNVDSEGIEKSQLLSPINNRITREKAYLNKVYVSKAGAIEAISVPFVIDVSQNQAQKSLKITLSTEGEDNHQRQSAIITNTFLDYKDGRGAEYKAHFEEPIVIAYPQVLDITMELIDGEGEISLSAFAPVHESSWDDGLPTSKPGYIAYSGDGGLYQGDLNLEMYWPDDSDKLIRFKELLTTGDYIFITSNRQWGTVPRVPERYPLSTAYYRLLMGCPESLDIVTCYNLAEPGMYQGKLGFELVKTFTSYPTLFDWEFNDQFAEEAFSVYDHPKVMIFKKTADFTPALLDQLDGIDLDKAVFLTPKQAHTYRTPADGEKSLMLNDDALEIQRSGGTWSELFDRESLVNRSPFVAVVVFYLFVTVLGWLVFPITQIAFKGLRDKGYAFSKLIGLMLFAWIAFVFGSNGVVVTQGFLWIILAVIAAMGIVVGVLCRKNLAKTIRHNWEQFLIIEALALLSFSFFLWVRYLNPDLWHPWKGGEKPMDFSYLNAVIKSSTFPAYDPWFAGGYINYYYYGQVIVGMPVKALGIVPAVAYNIILPLWYSLLMVGTFSVSWNISKLIRKDAPEKLFGISFWAGLFAMILVGFLGNLGELKVISEAWMLLGSHGRALQDLNVWQRLLALFKGIGQSLKGNALPVPPGNWYWNPSRAIPGEPITEFPYFTFLYGDLHAHLIAMPIVMSSIGWSLSILGRKLQIVSAKLKDYVVLLVTFLIGGLIIGALKPTNTWDIYTFFALAACTLIYVIARYGVGCTTLKTKEWQTRLIFSLLAVAFLYELEMVMYAPFNSMFKPGYSQIGFWTGDKTPISSYIMHWGLPLFIILIWLAWETYQWMAKTKLSELRKVPNLKKWIIALFALGSIALIALLVLKVGIAIIALPVCFWALLLVLSPEQSDGKRFVHFIIGTGFLLTIVVELVHLVGDIGRMNVVFKLYMQAWLLINIAAASALAIILRKLPRWSQRKQVFIQIPLIMLALSALLFPILATRDKATDRMSAQAPHTLDGMKYMESSTQYLDGIAMDLGQDYGAIRWLQDNVEGSPVILEAQAFEYYWGNRYTVYTGLPGVVGWNYHQRQQRAIWANNAVWDRVESVNEFYLSTDQAFVSNYLKAHDIGYIIVGQQEHIRYHGEGLDKFETLEGILWDKVYSEADTVIYNVR